MTTLLGISAFYHDSAACLVRDGKIIAAAQEERFTRKKHDAGFPSHAVQYCLREAGLTPGEIDFVIFYDKPLLKFERLIETYLAFAPRGLASFIRSMPVWIKEKLFLPRLLSQGLNQALSCREKWDKKFLFAEHHQSHAASAFFPSPYEHAAVLTMDGVGEWATTSLGVGRGNRLDILYEQHFPHSAGLLYSAFTYYTGFKVNSGEYKVMGLAPYGQPRYTKMILENLIDLKDDGSFRMNLDFFNYATGLTMTNCRLDALFGGPPRPPEAPLTQREMDLAASIQAVIEEIVLRTARFLKRETGEDNLCLAGGVALNCVANGKILREGIFKNIWIQPAAGDAGGAVGAALAAWYQYLDKPREVLGPRDFMQGASLGPSFDSTTLAGFLRDQKIPFETMKEDEVVEKTAKLLSDGNVIGWFQGRMEFGPRALGNRSILGDPRNPKMQSLMNLKIKYRESFRPFAPSVLKEKVSDYFEFEAESPYMLMVAPVRPERRLKVPDGNLWGIDLLNVPRSDLPAITHVDYSARLQTVTEEQNPLYYRLLKKFEEKTGVGVLINTSFNVRGEPIVCTPADAYRCFIRTEMDYLVLGNYLLDKTRQPPLKKDTDWRYEFELD